MVVTVYFLGILLVLCIVIFIINKRRLITVYTTGNCIESQSEGTFRLLTYNVAGLPEKISSAKANRYTSILSIGEKINNYDIVNVQEDFNYNIQLYSQNVHPYKTAHRGKAMWGDGLNTFSKFPILEFRRVAWRKCNGSDCLTPKGFSLARICIARDITVDVYNVHATAANSNSAARARQRNLLQLADYINTYSVGRPLIVMGDFNAHYQFELDNMFEFIKMTDLKDSWVEAVLGGTYPTIKPFFTFISDLDCDDNTESIDKILFRSNDKIKFEPIVYKVELDFFRNENKVHLSDHLAVMVDLKWTYQS